MPKNAYNKPHLTFDQQVDLLERRGLDIGDRQLAIRQLRRIGYYRLSAYWYPFRALTGHPEVEQSQVADEFRPGYSLQHAVDLYEYDKTLRLLLLDAIERVEISVRVETTYHLGSRDPFAHTKPELLHPNFSRPKNKKANSRSLYDDWRLEEMSHYWRSSERFAEHFASKYELPMPIWISVELWDFGMLSRFYSGMHVKDKEHVARCYGIASWKLMESWLRSINHVRNISAHHGRLWNRNLDDQPKLPGTGEIPPLDHLLRYQAVVISRIYSVICILLHFMNQIDQDNSWNERVKQHIAAFPDVPHIDASDMGFPPNWDSQELWNLN